MIKLGTKLKVIDNSGELLVNSFGINKKKVAIINNKIKVNVLKGKNKSKVKELIITTTKYPNKYKDGILYKSNINGGIINTNITRIKMNISRQIIAENPQLEVICEKIKI